MKQLVILTALMAEAVPVVDFYRMSKLGKCPEFHHYRAELDSGQVQVDLLVCGIGAVRTRDAISRYLAQARSGVPDRWLNLGIAGALEFGIGQVVWGRTVGSQSIGLPGGVDTSDIAEVVSVVQPEQAYRAGTLFDMEAESCLAAIEENSLQFVPQHLFCAKVISDNPARDTHQISKQWVTELIRKQIESLDSYILNIISSIE